MSQLKKHFTRLGDKQDAIVLAIGEVFGSDAFRVAVAQVHAFAFVLGNLGGERDLGAAFFDAVFERSKPADMGRMREDTPGHVFEPVPLFEEIVATMVTDGFDVVAVADTDFFQVRRVNDQFAAVGQHGFEFIHAFAGGPKFVIHRRTAGDDGVKWLLLVSDVEFAGEVAGFVPGGFGSSGKEAGEVFLRVNDHAKAKFVGVDHCAGAIDDFADGGPFVADDHRIGNDRAEPMEEVQNLRSANAWEKVFVASGKTDDFMREHRADDDDLVVFENLAIDLDGNVHGEKAVGELADFFGGECADAFEGSGVVPFVIEKAHCAELFAEFSFGNFQPFTDCPLAHRLVGAESDEDVEGLRDFADAGVQGFEHRADRGGACAVRNDEEDGFVAEFGLGAGADGDFGDPGIVEGTVFGSGGVERGHGSEAKEETSNTEHPTSNIEHGTSDFDL